ncbi:serine hydrolase domain-containing protein [Ruania alba]|uniref:CubicO group peptidase, beta-lactamase class C family n=1 Tax=Ruania alba TaxID=648782 RepID=A0A1H5M4A1_9MICO|nr:serine hydrolase domain-containing protein [Ruania alba]SEE83318.1 CubicO group peptidase, beta-lactamase class C family [Ruania alba]
MSTLSTANVNDVLAPHVGADAIPGLTWLARDGDQVVSGALGHRDLGGTQPLTTDEIFRISSMTKPVTALTALILVTDGALQLTEPVDTYLPELAERRVLRHPHAELDDTVPADRPITVTDLLTNTSGWGMDFTDFSPTPLSQAWAERGTAPGPPAPAGALPTDAWLAAASDLPLQAQPGQRWLYNTSSLLTGMLIERVAGARLGEVMAERIFEPLGMHDTAFRVPAHGVDRFGACFAVGEDVYDSADGQWAQHPPADGGDAGLVSTVSDYVRFADLVHGGGAVGDRRLVREDLVQAMTTNQLAVDVLARGGPAPDGGSGWGYGCGVLVRPAPSGLSAGSYGWDGGLGSRWFTDPVTGRTGILLTNRMWTSPQPPEAFRAFEALIGSA